VYPFFAIITAQYMYNLSSEKSLRLVRLTQFVITGLMLILVAALQYFFQPGSFNRITAVGLIILWIVLVFFLQNVTCKAFWRIGLSTLLVSFIVNIYLNLAFYPSLLHYQALTEAALYINENNPTKMPVLQSGDVPFAMEFYLDQPLTNINTDGTGTIPPKPYYLFAQTDIIKSLEAKGWHLEHVKSFERYWISRLKPRFLNKATRAKELSYSELVIVR